MEIRNLKKALNKFKAIEVMDFKPLVNKALLIVEAEAKALVPVNLGNLRDSIHPEIKINGESIIGRIYTQTSYAAYVEFGTGIKGNGTYPYMIDGLSLEYRNTPWSYEPEGGGDRIWTAGQVAQSFMYPALKNNEKKILKLTQDEIRIMLIKITGGGK